MVSNMDKDRDGRRGDTRREEERGGINEAQSTWINIRCRATNNSNGGRGLIQAQTHRPHTSNRASRQAKQQQQAKAKPNQFIEVELIARPAPARLRLPLAAASVTLARWLVRTFVWAREAHYHSVAII